MAKACLVRVPPGAGESVAVSETMYSRFPERGSRVRAGLSRSKVSGATLATPDTFSTHWGLREDGGKINMIGSPVTEMT